MHVSTTVTGTEFLGGPPLIHSKPGWCIDPVDPQVCSNTHSTLPGFSVFAPLTLRVVPAMRCWAIGIHLEQSNLASVLSGPRDVYLDKLRPVLIAPVAL